MEAVAADITTIRDWADAQKVGSHEINAVNRARMGHGLPPFRLTSNMMGRRAFAVSAQPSEEKVPVSQTVKIAAPPAQQPTIAMADALRGRAKQALKDRHGDRARAQVDLISAIRRDPDALWELFRDYADLAVRALFLQVSPEPPTVRPAVDRMMHAARPKLKPRPAAMASVVNIAAQSLLDTFKIDGRAIGDMTAAEANAAAGRRERDARFIRLLTANLPPHETIRKWRSAEDAARLLREADDAA